MTELIAASGQILAIGGAIFGAFAVLGFIADHMPSTPAPADFQGDDEM
ncbi:MAG: hypothetical protein ACTHJ9_13810 [Rhodanobacter sp.]